MRTIIICLSLVLVVVRPSEAALSAEEIYEKTSASVLMLEVENAQKEKFVGSAFVTLRPGLAVTAWHVVHDAKKIQAYLPGKRQIKVLGLVAKDENRDLAFLEIEPAGQPLLPLKFTKPRIGAKIYVIGSPQGLDFSIADGLISQVRDVDGFCHYQLSCPISPGNSGGPVVNDAGEVLGVVSWRKPQAQNVSFAVPSFELDRLEMLQTHSPVAVGNFATNAVFQGGERTSKQSENQSELGKFQEALAAHAGKQLTIVLDDGSARQEFTIEAPQKIRAAK